jgi:hypothetical protein
VKYDYSIKEPLGKNIHIQSDFKQIEEEVNRIHDHFKETDKNEKTLNLLIETFKKDSKNLLEAIKIKSIEEETLKKSQEEFRISTEDKRVAIEGILQRIDIIIKLNSDLKTNKESQVETEVIVSREIHLLKIKKEVEQILIKQTDKEIKIETLLQPLESFSPTKKLDETIHSLGDEAKNKSHFLKSEIDQQIYNFEQHLKQSHERDSYLQKLEEILEKLIIELASLSKEKENRVKEVNRIREEVSKLKWENELKQKKFEIDEENFNISQAKQIVFLLIIFVILIIFYLFL